MKIYWILDVELVDFKTFQTYEGAEAFEAEFKPFAKSRLVYRFDDVKALETAEKRLVESQLAFSKFVRQETESDDEMKNHPAFYVSFSSDYDTVIIKDGKFSANLKKLQSRNFQDDTGENIMVVAEKAKKFLEAQTVGITFEPLENKPKTFYQLTTVPELHFPMIYNDHTIVTPSPKREGKYSMMSDGTADLEPGALDQIARHGLTVSRSFKVKETVYPDAYSVFIASGAFVSKLLQHFDIKREYITVTPLALHL